MRTPKPYYKKSSQAWNADVGPNGRPLRLASGEEAEAKAYV